ncbi:hypothetical protein HDU79_008621 [Rhizoclosmatium sp. JEL0117]|nr:hypothetical protein HDU79_008621 [Rhizoclosmatium sp. JEL0117]
MSSAALIRHLLADLVQTTDSARRFKSEAEKARREKAALGEQVAPLRAELARLTAENNAVHLDLVRMSDDRDARDRKAADQLRRAKLEQDDLKFMAAQYAQKLSAEQKRNAEDREKAEQTMAKLGLFDTSLGNSSKKLGSLDAKKKQQETLLERLQKIDIDTGLEPLAHPSPAFTPPEPITINALQITQSRVDQLEKTVSELSNQNADLESQLHECRDQVVEREKEVMRLGAQLELARANQFSNVQVHGKPLDYMRDEGAPSSPTQTIHQLPIARARIEQLESQIEHLQAHIDTLEQERAGVVAEKAQFAQGFKDERDFLKMELEAEREKNRGLILGVGKVEKMVEGLKVLKEGLLRDGRPVSGGGGAEAGRKSVNGGGVQDFSLDLVNEIEKFQNTIRNLESIVNEKTTRVQQLEFELAEQRNAYGSVQDIRALESKVQELQTQLKEKDRHRSGLERDVAALRRQLDVAVKTGEKVEPLEDELQTLRAEKDDVERELGFVTKERNDIIAILERFEAQLTEMHDTVEQLTADRDNMTSLYQQTHGELQNLRAKASTTPSPLQPQPQRPGSTTPKQQSPLSPQQEAKPSPTKSKPDVTATTLQINLEMANLRIEELQQREKTLLTDISNLQGDLKATLFRHREHQAHAEETVRQIEVERDAAIQDVEDKLLLIRALEEKVEIVNAKVAFKEQEVVEGKRRIEELVGVVGVVEGNLADANMQLKEARSKLTETQSKLDTTQTQLLQSQKECREQAEKISMHRDLISKVDQDRDHYRNEIDEQTERLSEAKAALETTQAAFSKAQGDLAQAYEQLEQMSSQWDAQDRELSGLLGQVRVLTVERDRYLGEQNRAHEDLRNLSADLAAMTKESQVLNAEITSLARERDALQSDLSECENQISYLDSLVREKDHEKDHAMNSYMKVVQERDRLDLQLRTSTEEVGHLRMEIIMRDKRVAQVQRELEESQSNLAKLKIDLGAYEKQCSNLTKSLATTERTCRHLETEKQRLLREVGAVRDLAQTFDRTRDTVQMELSSAKMEAERLTKNLEKALAEQDHLVNELRNEKLKYERLESLLAAERTKKMVIEKSERDNLLGQQASSLSAVTRELASANQELQLSRQTVDRLEGLVQSQGQELEECRLRIQVLVEANEKGKQPVTQTKEPQPFSRSVSSSSHTSGQETDLEKRIKSELESTKEQLRSYEKQIEERLSRTSTPK